MEDLKDLNKKNNQDNDSEEKNEAEFIDLDEVNFGTQEEEYTDPGNLDIETINQNNIKGDVGAVVTINTSSEEIVEKEAVCGQCTTVIELKRYGVNECPNPKCDGFLIRRNLKLDVFQLSTIEDKKLESDLLNLFGKINNNLIRRRFEKAMKLCKQAEQIAPREPTTWRYYSLSEFYFEMSRERTKRKKIDDILRIVRDNLVVCKVNNLEEKIIDQVREEIANHIFNISKAQIGNHFSKAKKSKIYWSKKGRNDSIYYMKLFEKCYELSGNIFYLKEYLKELATPHKWLSKTLNGEIINTLACGRKFNARGYWFRILAIVNKINPDYEPPEIKNQIFVIKDL